MSLDKLENVSNINKLAQDIINVNSNFEIKVKISNLNLICKGSIKTIGSMQAS